jgi:hypothetical protein
MIIQRQASGPLSPSLSPPEAEKERCYVTIPNSLFFHISNYANPSKVEESSNIWAVG